MINLTALITSDVIVLEKMMFRDSMLQKGEKVTENTTKFHVSKTVFKCFQGFPAPVRTLMSVLKSFLPPIFCGSITAANIIGLFSLLITHLDICG